MTNDNNDSDFVASPVLLGSIWGEPCLMRITDERDRCESEEYEVFRADDGDGYAGYVACAGCGTYQGPLTPLQLVQLVCGATKAEHDDIPTPDSMCE